MSVRLPYGENAQGLLVKIDDVPRGAACGCVCPQCRAPLIARQGDDKRHHFAHAADQDCVGAYETMVHKLAKQLLQSQKWVWLPAAVAQYMDLHRTVARADHLWFHTVQQEVRLGAIQPDVIGHHGSGSLLIEVFVTHRCTPEKLTELARSNQDAIEIDLSRCPRDIDADLLARFVLKEAPRRWLYSAAIRRARADLARQHKEALREAERQRALASQREADRQRAEARQLAKQEQEKLRYERAVAKATEAQREHNLGRHNAYPQMPSAGNTVRDDAELEAWRREMFVKAERAFLDEERARDFLTRPSWHMDFSIHDLPSRPTPGERASYDYDLAIAAGQPSPRMERRPHGR